MKKFKIITLVTIVILIVGLSSCNEKQEKLKYPTTPTKWVVDRIRQNTNEISFYHVCSIEKEDINFRTNSTWFVDSVGKFTVGDTVSFYTCH